MRADLTNELIHFIKGASEEDAYQTLVSILRDKCLIGSTGRIRGAYRCVCFTELPRTLLQHQGFVNQFGTTRYKKFGIMLPKEWLFEHGGRPVIYQTDEEFNDLPESHRWRHVRFDPLNGVDFTWEREWRIQIDELPLDSSLTEVFVPDPNWDQRLRLDHEVEQDFKVVQYTLIQGELAELYREEFGWNVTTVEG